MTDKVEKARWAILRVLADEGRPVGAKQLGIMLPAVGVDLRPRSIRHHLVELDRAGLTRLVSRRSGREITEKGRQKVVEASGYEKMQVVSALSESLGYRMSFDMVSGEGTVIINVSYVDRVDLGRVLEEMKLATDQGFGISTKVAVMGENCYLGEHRVPEGSVGVGTICSMTLNGIFRSAGIPVRSRFCGLLEIRERQMTRFLNMIEYDGCTLDPIGIFMRADMMSVRDVVLRGSGVICVSFREVPAAARDHLIAVERDMKKRDLGGILATGCPNQPLFGVPVSDGYCGLVVVGGMNPVACAREAGVRLTFQSMAGLEDISLFTTPREALKRSG